MADQILRPDLIERLQDLARRENRDVNEVVERWINIYFPPLSLTNEEEQQAQLRAMILRMYERARKYWRETGNSERLALSDNELDEQFWLIDRGGVPRLKSEKGSIEIPPDPFVMMAEMAEREGWSSGRSDISENSSRVVGEIIVENYLRRRQSEQKSE